MASVTLDRLWLHRADDNADYILLQWEGAGGATSPNVTVRDLSGGRRRKVSRPGAARVLSYSIPAVSIAVREQVEAFADGGLLMIRDSRGRKEWGVIDVRVKEWRNPQIADLDISVDLVTYDEAV